MFDRSRQVLEKYFLVHDLGDEVEELDGLFMLFLYLLLLLMVLFH